jgi:hypothetical protein
MAQEVEHHHLENLMQIDIVEDVSYTPAELEHALVCLHDARGEAVNILVAVLNAPGWELYGNDFLREVPLKFHKMKDREPAFDHAARNGHYADLQLHADALKDAAAEAKELTESKLEQIPHLPAIWEVTPQLQRHQLMATMYDIECTPLYKILYYLKQVKLAVDEVVAITQAKVAAAQAQVKAVVVILL